jgi:hypothetical protein
MERRLRGRPRRKRRLLRRSGKSRRDLRCAIARLDFLAWIHLVYTHNDLTKFPSERINLFVNLEKCRAQQAV